MHKLTELRLPLTWLFLAAITLIAWWIGVERGAFTSGTILFIVIIAIAAIKVRVIVREFMEVRTASRQLKLLTDGWLVLLLCAFIIADLIAARFSEG
jgi:heme/copper-type cytochrome/quinol oxidase subunit 4